MGNKLLTRRTQKHERSTYLLLTDIHVRTILIIRWRTHGRCCERELVLDVIWPAACSLPVGSKAARTNVFFVAALAGVGPLVRVQPLVQLQMNKLGELGGTEVAGVWLLAGMQSEVSLEI